MQTELPQINLFQPLYEYIDGDVSTILWIAFGVLMFFFFIYSAILVYHWLKYGLRKHVVSIALSSYFLVSLALIATIAYSITRVAV